MEKRVSGLGGVFFKCDDPEKVKAWYTRHLGFTVDEYGGAFQWIQAEDPSKSGYTAWSPFSKSSDYFKPSEKEFMFNYRVENLEELLKILEKEGVEVVGEIQEFDYGKFAHIMDCEGNKVELWEPKDEVFDNYYNGKTMK